MPRRILRKAIDWRRPARWLLVAVLPLPALPAWAWNGAGHRLVACIAWDRLDDAQRDELAQLLRAHPDHARWLRRGEGTDAARTAFIEASTWPDDIRQDRRFYTAASEAPTPTLDGFPDMERRGDWHFVNYPLRGDGRGSYAPTHGAALSGRLAPALAAVAQTLGERGAAPAARSYALPWLIHLVGDAHQPLHTSVRLAADGSAEAHGMAVSDPFNRRKSETTLHAYWDDLPGPAWLRGERLDERCRSWAQSTESLPSSPHSRNSAPPEPDDPAQWIEESWQIARRDGYPRSDEAVPTISAEFDTRARAIARQRIAQAGLRLAALLRELLGD